MRQKPLTIHLCSQDITQEFNTYLVNGMRSLSQVLFSMICTQKAITKYSLNYIHSIEIFQSRSHFPYSLNGFIPQCLPLQKMQSDEKKIHL